VHKFFSHRSTFLCPICSEMISHCNLELSRLLTRSFTKQFSCPSPRATTIYAFLDSKEFEGIGRAAKHLNSSNLTRGPNADAKYGVGRLLYSSCIHCSLLQVVRECSPPGTVNPDRSDWLYVD
jgi:hypothetical protein